MIWVAEYSPSQNAFHVQPLGDALKANLRRVLVRDSSLDWTIFALGWEGAVRQAQGEVEKGQVRLSLRRPREAE
jgi:hypothetical protein